jgi:hypothetical protein
MAKGDLVIGGVVHDADAMHALGGFKKGFCYPAVGLLLGSFLGDVRLWPRVAKDYLIISGIVHQAGAVLILGHFKNGLYCPVRALLPGSLLGTLAGGEHGALLLRQS